MITILWISGGIVVAAIIAWAAVSYLPEDRVVLGLAVHEPINYEILPLDAKLADIERGRSYYIQLCALCHGSAGKGDGEYSYRMVPKPAPLTRETTIMKSDAELSAVIRDGIEGTAMRGWGDTLNQIQRQQVIEFIRYLTLNRRHQQS